LHNYNTIFLSSTLKNEIFTLDKNLNFYKDKQECVVLYSHLNTICKFIKAVLEDLHVRSQKTLKYFLKDILNVETPMTTLGIL
jgi:hypothetical protein